MKFNPVDPLQSGIIELLVEHQPLSIKEIHERLANEYNLSYTRQHIYKVISRMIELQMLAKYKGRVSIDVRWMVQVRNLAERAMPSSQGERENAYEVNLKEGQKKEFVVDSFATLIPLWDKIAHSLQDREKEPVSYQYFYHPYWALSRRSSFDDYYRYRESLGIVFYTLIGSDTPLDQLGLSLYNTLERRNAEIVLDSPMQVPGRVLEVIGDYVSEAYVPTKLESHFQFIFESITEVERFDEQLFQDIFKIKEPMKLVVRRDAGEAKAIREAVLSYMKDTPWGGKKKKS